VNHARFEELRVMLTPQTARSASQLVLSALVLGLLASTAAEAASFLAGVGCNGPFQESVGPGPVSQSCSVVVPGPFSPDPGTLGSFAQSSAGPGLGGLRVRSGAGVVAFPLQPPASAIVGAQAFAEWTFDDFTIVGPPGAGTTPVVAALVLAVSGTLSPASIIFDTEGSLTSRAAANMQFFLEIQLNGGDAGFGEIIRRISNGTIVETVDGLPVGHYGGEGAGSDLITSADILLPVGIPFDLHVYVNAGASASGAVSGVPADSSDFTLVDAVGNSDFSATVNFPTSGSVFLLSPGYTVHSPSAGIVDNRLVLPGASAPAGNGDPPRDLLRGVPRAVPLAAREELNGHRQWPASARRRA
jgi:hypothetical protein